MDLDIIKKLVRLVEKSEITEFSVQEGDLKLRISKHTNNNTSPVLTQQLPQQVAVPQPAQAEQPQQTKENPADAKKEDNGNLYEVKSPIVGTFYRAPAPDADPYVKVGDEVSAGSVLCIVEAMKLMNEIECDVNGKIAKILVDNATPVEYNQPLFLIER